jgi:zinc transport system substrate-binding protein
MAITHSLAAQVMGSAGVPELLVDRAGDPHEFQMRPSQARALAEADLVFWVGAALTPWFERALQLVPPEVRNVALLDTEGTRHLAHGATDPHAWLDPANARVWTAAIAAELSRADPANADLYAANAAAAERALTELDGELRSILATAEGVPLFTGHDAYGYLARAYDLTIAGALAAGDAAAPGAAHLAALRKELLAGEAPCLFTDPGQNPDLIANLIEGTEIRTATLDPAGGMLPPGPEHYAETMRALAHGIADCVAGK